MCMQSTGAYVDVIKTIVMTGAYVDVIKTAKTMVMASHNQKRSHYIFYPNCSLSSPVMTDEV
jgi:hypothetical protein